MLTFDAKSVLKLLFIYLMFMFSILFASIAYAEFGTTENLGRENLAEEEQKINVSSYNPTEPEIQMGQIKYMTIDESGAVMMDTEVIQGGLETSGNVYIEGVPHKDGDKYYVIEKGGYIISIFGSSGKIASSDGSVVKVREVEQLYGHNGLATLEGFWSNIVPKGFLPKTGEELTPEQQEIIVVSNGLIYGSLIVCVFILILMATIFKYSIRKPKKEGN